MPNDTHAETRHTASGRWLPVVFYSVNVASCFLTCVAARAWDLLWLGVLPAPALALYIIRTRR